METVTVAVFEQPETPASVAVIVAMPFPFALTVVERPAEGLALAMAALSLDHDMVPTALETERGEVWPMDVNERLAGEIVRPQAGGAAVTVKVM